MAPTIATWFAPWWRDLLSLDPASGKPQSNPQSRKRGYKTFDEEFEQTFVNVDVKSFKMDEVKQHNSKGDAWLVIRGYVFDISNWGAMHPGGDVIYDVAGSDATDQFEGFHLPRVTRRLRPFLIGTVSDYQQHLAPETVEYRELRSKLWAEGWFEVHMSYYIIKHLIIAAMGLCAFLTAGWAGMAVTGKVPPTIAGNAFTWACGGDGLMVWLMTLCGMLSLDVAVCVWAGVILGMFWHQSAFIAHDACHNGVVEQAPALKGKGAPMNWLGWLHGSVIFGISAAKWLDEHNVHHAITLRPRSDPQFNYLPMWLQSKLELKGHGGDFEPNWLMKALVRIQHITLLPLCVLAGRVNFYCESFAYAFRHKRVDDFIGMGLYWAWFSYLLSLQPTWTHFFIYFAVSHIMVGALHVQLLVSHLATNVYTREEEERLGFFRFQLQTSRNIDSTWWNHWFHGGLEKQIEHHLFPQLPRYNLSRVKPYVQGICQRNEIVYESIGFFNSIGVCLANFKETAHDLIYLNLG